MSWTATIALGGVALVATAIAFMLAARLKRANASARRREFMAAGTGAALSAAGGGVLIWPRNGDQASTEDPVAAAGLGRLFGSADGRPPSYHEIRSYFAAGSADALDEALERLRSQGRGFQLTLHDRSGRPSWSAVGLRAGIADGEADILSLRDIREEASVEASLRAELSRMRGMLDALPIPVWSRRANLEIDDCNIAYARSVDAESPADAVAGLRELASSGAHNPVRALAEKARAEGKGQRLRGHVVVDGARRLFEINEEPLDGTGRLTGFAVDLTEVEDAEGELRRHVAAHGEVLEKLGTAIVIYGPDRRVKFFNRAYASLWNFDEAWLESGPELGEVLEAMREARLLPETADFPAFKATRMKQFTSLIEPVEELVHVPDGTTLRQVITPHPMGGLLYTYEDVTDRLVLERSYNTLIDVQRETLDNLAEGVAVFGGDGRLKLSNPVFGSMWNLPLEFIGSEPHIAEVLEAMKSLAANEAEWPEFRQSWIEMVTGREERTGRINRTDSRYIEYGLLPLPDGGMLARYLDVTDSSRVERALRDRTEALEHADRLKSEFIANVSYELRTPLNTIIGFTEILNNEYFGPLTGRQKEYSEGILEASQRLLALINDILELASIEAGRVVLNIGRVDAQALMQQVHNLSREWAREEELTLTVDCAPDVGMMEGDERRLKHALFNLVGNAIKFTEAGGRISLSAQRDGDDILFKVNDNGIGISADDRDHVFEKFFRGRDSEGRAVGVGLGLSLVKSVIELHGGDIDVQSAEGRGTTITCRLPSEVTTEDEKPTVPVPKHRASA